MGSRPRLTYPSPYPTAVEAQLSESYQHSKGSGVIPLGQVAIAYDAQQLSRFVGYFEGKIAKEAGRLHNWRGKFWARRFRPIVVSDEPDAQVERLRYLLSQGCKETSWHHPGTGRALPAPRPR